MDSIRLQDAYLCADCLQVVGNAKVCVCGSEHGLMSLSSVLNRELSPTGDAFDRLSCAVGALEMALAD